MRLYGAPKIIGKCVVTVISNGTIVIAHQSGECGHFPRARFEAAVAPLDQLTEHHAEAVERYFGENF